MTAYRPDIDGLRAIAVVAVVLYHLGVPGFGGGFVGVDVFFVISGFLITGIIAHGIEQGTFTYAEFYARRIRRIAPALLATLAATAIAAVLFLAPEHLRSFGASLIAAVASVSNVLFWTESGYFDVAAEVKPLLHTWSLGVEEQFYLVWPLTLALLARGPRWLAPLVCLALVAVGSAAGEAWLRTDPEAAFYLLPSRLGELALGAALVWLPGRARPTAVRSLGFIVGMFAILLAVIAFSPRIPVPGLIILIPCVGTALVIACRPPRPLSRLLENRLAVQVGRMSYSIYLVHWPVIVFWQYYRFAPLTPVDQIGAALVTVALASILYFGVETPFRRRSGKNWAVPTKALYLAAGGAAAVVVLAGLATLASDGSLVSGKPAGSALQANLDQFRASGVELVDKGDADILLLGDSHADHYTEAVVAAAAAAGMETARSNAAGCPPFLDGLPPLDRARLTADQISCLDRQAEWLAEVRGFDGGIIVLASRWSMLTEPSHYGRYRVRRHWLLVDLDDPNDLAGPRERFRTAIRKTVELITALGKRVVILGQVPETGIDLNACYAAPQLILPSPQERCISVSSDQMLDRLRFSNEVFSVLARENPAGVQVFQATESFCPNGECRIDLDGTLLYRNEDHITEAASLHLAGDLGREISFRPEGRGGDPLRTVPPL